ncbi:MAG: IS1595 family transposase [Candidatus Hydrogenedentes bacterium]|nr:IS1595 family transposase [Candidatus Hydrogenedentota bacterium]
MDTQETLPKTLMEAVRYFADYENCHNFVATMRWSDKETCPHCQSTEVRYMEKVKRFQCRGCRRQFTLKTGTVFEDSPIGLDKWLCAIWMHVNCKNGVSSYEVHRALGVTQKTAWFMGQRIRLAMQNGSIEKLSGSIEVDETLIGGKARFMSPKRREKMFGKGKNAKTGSFGKVVVMGVLERSGEVRTEVITSTKRKTLDPLVRKHVEKGSNVYTDALASYESLRDEYIHQTIDHAKAYVSGQIHTNGLENFWSLLKRGIKGTYVSVEPFHLFRYLDEQAYRYNKRKLNDRQRFVEAVRGIIGKRLTYSALTAQETQPRGC